MEFNTIWLSIAIIWVPTIICHPHPPFPIFTTKITRNRDNNPKLTTAATTTYYRPQYALFSSSIEMDHFNINANKPNPFNVIYEWKILDFQYDTPMDRQTAINNGDFVPENNLPLGIDRWNNRLFITMPRWKNGVPASLAWLPLPGIVKSPAMIPYPNLAFHSDPLEPDCTKLMSVYRIWIDECDRLWIIDAGIVNATIKMNPVCPPKIMAFNLHSDELILTYEFPSDQIKEDSLHSNIIVDIRNGMCNDAYVYVPDVWRFGVLVYSLNSNRSWRTTNHLYLPNPFASDFTLNGINFQWTDGVFGISLSPINENNERLMYFHPMSSFTEFVVNTSILRNETLWTIDNGLNSANAFEAIGERGVRGQSSTSGIDRKNVMYFNLVQRNAIGCWDTNKKYRKGNLNIIGKDDETLIFPNDLKVDREHEQGIWVISNRLPIYLYSKLDFNDVNFRVNYVLVNDVIKGTTCDPLVNEKIINNNQFDKCY